MDRAQAEVFALHMLTFLREQWPALEVAALEVGRDDKDDVLWCKIYRSEDEPTRGGGYLFTVSYLDRTLSEQSG